MNKTEARQAFKNNVKAVRGKIDFLRKIASAKNLGYLEEDINSDAVGETKRLILLLEEAINYINY